VNNARTKMEGENEHIYISDLQECANA